MIQREIQQSKNQFSEQKPRKYTDSVNKMKPQTYFGSTKKSTAFTLVILYTILISLICPVNCRLITMGSNSVVVMEEVARCRATCLDKFLFGNKNSETPIDACLDQSDCSMCWDYCQFLHREKRYIFKAMCSDAVCVSVY